MNSRALAATASKWVDQPEINIAIFAFLLNFVWEIWQIPLYDAAPTSTYLEGIASCTLATFGDAVIALIAFWSVAAVARSRRWIVHPSLPQVVGFVVAGIVITIVLEILATGPLERWAYSDDMPLLPVIHVGLTPFLQWLLLPPVIVWFVKRQLA